MTGGRGAIGSAIGALLDDPLVLDLPEFDVGDPEAWRSLEGEFDAAFLNAGTSTGFADAAELADEEWQRILRANLEGVVYGTRELASRLMPGDPAYTATKHAVVGWVRAAAPALAARNIRLNALCPGFTDTPLVEDELRDALDVPLMEPAFVADAALRVLEDAETGRAWVVQPNRIEPFRFPGVPGPR